MNALRLIPHLTVSLACALLIVVAVFLVPAGASEADDAADRAKARTEADALQARYASNVRFTDFASFSKRMDAVRGLGKLDTPRARTHLLRIARAAKGIDDRIVAFTALGPKLDVAEARALADMVSRRRDPLLTQALTQAYILAAGDEVLTWLATTALLIKEPAVLQAVIDAQSIHGDVRARPGLRAIFEAHKDRERTVILAHGALRAIGTIGHADDLSFLIRVAALDDWRLRLACAETIARQKTMETLVRATVVKLLHDDHPVVTEAAAESAGRASMVELTDNLADRLKDEHVRTRAVAHEALVEMHGHDLGWDPDDWKRWWKVREGLPEDIQRAPSSSVTSYYGVTAHSDRLLFIIDLSGSMAFPWGAEVDKTRIGVAKRQLTKAIEGLHEKTLFNVIVFSDDVKSWRKSGEVIASTAAKASALKWVDKMFEKPQGGTFMHAALETAFSQNPKVDTIFLLTDGLATDGEPIVPEAILASVNRWNRFRRVVLHTFALTLEDLQSDGLHKDNLVEIKRFMKRLATLTGGECRVITKPPPSKSNGAKGGDAK